MEAGMGGGRPGKISKQKYVLIIVIC